jgi:hypothetical protein
MKYQDFKKAINKPYFSRMDILLNKIDVFGHQLSLWRKKGYLENIRRGLDIFSDEKNRLSAEEISFLVYQPSYLSLEYALSHYGIIPEMVFAKTSVTTKTTRTFSNGFGIFSYRHIQPKLFFGYIAKDTTFGKYLLAEPEKALLDYLYFNLGKINDEKDISELRINSEELKRVVDKKKLDRYLQEFGIQKLEKITRMII